MIEIDVAEVATAEQRVQPRTVGELRDYVSLMAEAEEIAEFGVWRWEIATGVVQWSTNLERIYGVEPGGFAGTVEAFVGFLHPDDRQRIWQEVEQAIAGGEPFSWQERIIRADGEQRVLRSRGRPVRGADGRVSELIGICHDVTRRVHAELALGLSEQRLRAIVEHSPSLIAVKDLQHRYLLANEETGRLLGVAPSEVLGKLCGEVFPTLAEQMQANDDLAASSLAPVFDELELTIESERRTYRTVTFPLPDDDGHALETCTIATDVTERRQLEHASRERTHWSEQITSAIRDGRMRVFAQPVIEIATGAQVSAELLIRMRSETDHRLLLPAEFLPQAERYGLIQAVDIWMVSQAVSIARHRAVEVNLSSLTLGDDSAREQILALLRAAPKAAARLVFEVTETAAAENLDAACSFAAELTDLGCALALDDFGTGFGSFTYLRQLPLRYLKIDASFVRNVCDCVDDRRIVRSIIGIAEQFGLRTIAEGVEDQATLSLLGEFGADYAQGHLIGLAAELARSISRVLLYNSQVSGNCYKVRLLCAHLGLPLEKIELDVVDRSNRQEVIGHLNPALRVPTLVLDDGRPLVESNAIIDYLAEGTEYIPADAYERAQAVGWQMFEQYEIEPNLAVARFFKIFDLPVSDDFMEARYAAGSKGLAALERGLTGKDWLVGGHYGVADISLYAYTHVAAEGGFDLEPYPSIRAWVGRVAAQPGHIPITD